VQDKATKYLTTIDINEAHDKMGHKGEELIQKALKTIGCKVTGIHLLAVKVVRMLKQSKTPYPRQETRRQQNQDSVCF
jgi:hypothetical protein